MLGSTKKPSLDLLSDGEGQVIFRFSLPIIFSYLLQQIYTISDAAICGQTLSVDEIAGVNDSISSCSLQWDVQQDFR